MRCVISVLRICDEDGMAVIVHEVTGVIFRGSLHKNHTIVLIQTRLIPGVNGLEVQHRVLL